MSVPQIAILQGRSPMGVEERLLTSIDPSGRVRPNVLKRAGAEPLRRALELYGREMPSWGSLYKVYELIRQHLGGDDSICRTGLATSQDLKRFRSTANLPALGGLEARHAAKEGDGPAAMELSEADALIRSVLAECLSKDLGGERADPGGVAS